MLNDIAAFTRWSSFLQTLGPGVAFGGSYAGLVGHPAAFPLLMTGLVLIIAWGVGISVVGRSRERRVVEETVRGSDEIVAGAVVPAPAIGRVVRRRIKADAPAYSAGAPRLPGPAAMVVLEAVGDGPPRRVAVLVPAWVGLHLRGQLADLWLHPHRREVAVLDTAVSPGRLEQIARDPRWGVSPTVTDRSVVGGWLPVFGVALAGLLVGAGSAILVTLVL